MQKWTFFPFLFPLLLLACQKNKKANPNLTASALPVTDKKMVVEVVKPELRLMESYLTAKGILEPKNQVTIFAPISGFIDTIYKELGSELLSGETILVLKNEPLFRQKKLTEARIIELKNDSLLYEIKLERVKSEEQFCKKQFDRINRNYGSEASKISVNELDKSETEWKMTKALRKETEVNLKKAKASLKTTEIELENLNNQIEDLIIKAPFSGTIIQSELCKGDWIDGVEQVREPTPIMKFSDLKNLKIKVEYPENEAHLIENEAKVKVRFPVFPKLVLEEKITQNSNIINPENKKMIVEIALDSPISKLKSGMVAIVKHQNKKQKRALFLPSKSIHSTSDGDFIFVVKKGVLNKIPIDIIQKNKEEMELWSPELTGNENIVFGVNPYLKDGMVVDIFTEKIE